MCTGTRSFRSIFSSTTKLRNSSSYGRRYQCERMLKMNGWHKTNRRFGNEAVSRFIQLIDLDRKHIAGQVFTCSKCELEMVAADFKQLRLSPVDNSDTKRLHSVVIDAKVIGLLKKSGELTDHHDVLSGVSRLQVRLSAKRPPQNAVVMFIKNVRNCISKVRNQRIVQCGRGSSASFNKIGGFEEGYMIRRNHLFVRLSDMKNHGNTSAQKTDSNVMKLIGIIRWYINNTACLCPAGTDCVMNPVHGGDVTKVVCGEQRRKLENSE